MAAGDTGLPASGVGEPRADGERAEPSPGRPGLSGTATLPRLYGGLKIGKYSDSNRCLCITFLPGTRTLVSREERKLAERSAACATKGQVSTCMCHERPGIDMHVPRKARFGCLPEDCYTEAARTEVARAHMYARSRQPRQSEQRTYRCTCADGCACA